MSVAIDLVRWEIGAFIIFVIIGAFVAIHNLFMYDELPNWFIVCVCVGFTVLIISVGCLFAINNNDDFEDQSESTERIETINDDLSHGR